MIAEIKGKCQFKNCEKEANCLACGRYHSPACYCEEHASIIIDEQAPEYIEHCPNCGCRFGVN